jgi:hypothetical protein
METTDLKELWKTIPNPKKNTEQLVEMLKESNHPILKGIRRQLTLELIGFSVFLACYYTMFDGTYKPVLSNLVLILAIVTPIFHNIKGYWLYQNIKDAANLRDSLNAYLKRVNNYAVQAIGTRLIFAAGLMFFFTNGLNLGPQKLLLASCGILVIFSLQLFFLYKIWKSRIDRLKININALATI